jgi:hypothetical protein
MPATDDELALARNWRPFGARFERMNRAMFDVRSHLPNISPKGK